MEGCDCTGGFGCSWETPPTDKCKTCGISRMNGNCYFLVLVSTVYDKYYSCECPCFLSDNFYKLPATQQEPLTQMDVKNVQLEQLKKKKGQLFKKQNQP